MEKQAETGDLLSLHDPDQTQEATTMEPKSNKDEEHTMGTKLDQKPTQGNSKPLMLESTYQKPWRGVISSLLIKEEPPDAKHPLHLSNTPPLTKGNLLNSHLYEDINLIYVCADPTILRTKFSQGGGYDVVIKPVAEPELHQLCHSSHLESDQDTCAFHGEYRSNPEYLRNKSTCYRRLSHHRITTRWNQVNRSSDRIGIEFTKPVTPAYPVNEAAADQCAMIDSLQLNHDD